MKKPIHSLPKLIASIIICQLAGVIGSFFTISSIPTWYATLSKPFFSPPNWLFGPVWIALYTLMGISLYLVWIRDHNSKKSDKSTLTSTAITWFVIQLVLNSIWSILFFGLRSPTLAFIEIVLLWVAIILTIKAFCKVSKTASLLLVPYLTWVSFAAMLNLAIVLLN